MATAFKRRNYLTKKDFQTRFMLPFLAASLLANIITVTLFIVLARNKIDSLLFSMRMPDLSAGALLSPLAFLASIAAVVALSLVFLWAARGMYGKIAGPLQQIRGHLHQIGSGDLSTRIVLRENDEFKDFAGEINAMALSLNRSFTVLQDHTAELAKAAEALRTSPPAEDAAAIRRSMATLVKDMEQQLGAFKR